MDLVLQQPLARDVDAAYPSWRGDHEWIGGAEETPECVNRQGSHA